MEKTGLVTPKMEEITIYPYLTKFPVIHESVFIAPGARVIGDVGIGEKSSVWFNCVIRGDILPIRIGSFTNIQDGSILHVTAPENPLNIGSYVTLGHNAVVHACTIEDYTLIGMGSVILDGAFVEKYSMVAAGAVVVPGMRVPSGKLVAGVPGKVIRDLTREEFDYFEKSALHYAEYAVNTKISLERGV